ncbi:MAG: hypothetical protein ABJN26_28025 [Stappiaceae bacterium]
MARNWLNEAAARYDTCNRDALEWILSRKPLANGFLNTKVNSLTGEDYTQLSGLRGPDFTYGWIQGRGLEALTTFAMHYRDTDVHLARQLEERAYILFEALSELHARDGHIYFLYNKDMEPVRSTSSNGSTVPQSPAGEIYTYSDAFSAKGLISAAHIFDPERLDQYFEYLHDVVAAIEADRFQMDEGRVLGTASYESEADDFGPRMILLGAAGVLHRADYAQGATFADRFIDDVLSRYTDQQSGLLLNVPGLDICNVGHAIEFCGFAFEHLKDRPEDPRIPTLTSILKRSLEVGLQGPGIALSLSAKTGHALSPHFPWWPMPEAVRACALGLQFGADEHLFELWQQADLAFFSKYWQRTRCFAYQTRGVEGPVDFVPATPDLDPAYHTGLSLLAAINTIEDTDH